MSNRQKGEICHFQINNYKFQRVKNIQKFTKIILNRSKIVQKLIFEIFDFHLIINWSFLTFLKKIFVYFQVYMNFQKFKNSYWLNLTLTGSKWQKLTINWYLISKMFSKYWPLVKESIGQKLRMMLSIVDLNSISPMCTRHILDIYMIQIR